MTSRFNLILAVYFFFTSYTVNPTKLKSVTGKVNVKAIDFEDPEADSNFLTIVVFLMHLKAIYYIYISIYIHHYIIL